ncbi:unnamed protein product [Ambrosiozyma monospora]|uniref:Unnamed protein product n=1 Tax=Ambrosiozyma monospora TaxID=43982 RepID=A0ACB5T303_AMBMO|nr:unnamed protein product [Ambrosiozyma monospora]
MRNTASPKKSANTNTSPRKRALSETPSTPSKRRRGELPMSPQSTSGKVHNPFNSSSTPGSSGRSLRTRTNNQLMTPESTPSKSRVIDTPTKSQPTTPRKRGRPPLKERLLEVANEKNSRSSLPSTLKSQRKTKTASSATKSKGQPMITSAHLVSFCNRFYLPENVTRNILDTYQVYYFKTNNPWGLLCGLVAIAYLRLNTDKIENQIGFKSKFYRTLQTLQNGGLSFSELSNWASLVEKLCAGEKWIRDFYDFDAKNSNDRKVAFGIPSLNSFITPELSYFSPEVDAKCQAWNLKMSKYLETGMC